MNIYQWITLIVIFSIMFYLVYYFTNDAIKHDDSERNLDYHRTHGKFQVLYSDGKISQPFTRKVAEDYAEMFGGKVINKIK